MNHLNLLMPAMSGLTLAWGMKNSDLDVDGGILPAHADSFVKGADVGWLPQMEATGYNSAMPRAGEDCLQILKDLGINTIRLRTWVNPSNDSASGQQQGRNRRHGGARAEDGHARHDQLPLQRQLGRPAAAAQARGVDQSRFPQLLKDVYVTPTR
jgi:arabinogalactan endo-1,4-beta-galactosidase